VTRAVKRGVTFSLAIPFDNTGPQVNQPRRFNPIHRMVRTGQPAMCRARGGWGDYADGDAPGLSFSTAEWIHRHELAAVATDTWGMEVRPNEIPDTYQPLHQVLIPTMGMLVGEIFDLEVLAADCARDKVYEFLFTAPPLPITGAVGSPVNPIAIK
jgi:kynurenine formamidase